MVDLAIRADLIAQADEFIRHRSVEIMPRRSYVGGGRSGRIPVEHLLQPGRALTYLSDSGWGRDLLKAKRKLSHADEPTVVAAAELIREWLGTTPISILYVPSFDPARSLVPDFARRLAAALNMPISNCIEKLAPTQQPQKLMQNSVQQFMNVHDCYKIGHPRPDGPVLLVDDVWNSGWTMTVIGVLLAESGVGPVYPFAIAKSRG